MSPKPQVALGVGVAVSALVAVLSYIWYSERQKIPRGQCLNKSVIDLENAAKIHDSIGELTEVKKQGNSSNRGDGDASTKLNSEVGRATDSVGHRPSKLTADDGRHTGSETEKPPSSSVQLSAVSGVSACSDAGDSAAVVREDLVTRGVAAQQDAAPCDVATEQETESDLDTHLDTDEKRSHVQEAEESESCDDCLSITNLTSAEVKEAVEATTLVDDLMKSTEEEQECCIVTKEDCIVVSAQPCENVPEWDNSVNAVPVTQPIAIPARNTSDAMPVSTSRPMNIPPAQTLTWGSMLDEDNMQEGESPQSHALLNTNNSHSCNNLVDAAADDDSDAVRSLIVTPRKSAKPEPFRVPLEEIECITSSTAPGQKKCKNVSPKKSSEEWAEQKGGRKGRRRSPEKESAVETKSSDQSETKGEDCHSDCHGEVRTYAMVTAGTSGGAAVAVTRPASIGSPMEHLMNSSVSSDHHSVESNDSGKGASDIMQSHIDEPLHDFSLYEFEMPQQLVGKLIGKLGRNVKSLRDKTGANVYIKRHPYFDTYKLCAVEGTPEEIKLALAVISKRFPPAKFPEMTLVQVNAPVDPSVFMPENMQLPFPEEIPVDVIVSSLVSACQVFLQQPTHPTYPTLRLLDESMQLCYHTENAVIPQLPRPIEVGVICAVPVAGMDGWYRAQVVQTQDETDEVDVRFCDYGGYCRMAASSLRQIRSDFMSLPFQATECYLANISPLDETEGFSIEAAAELEELTQGRVIQAQIVGRAEDGVPYVHLYSPVSAVEAAFVNRELVNRGVVQWTEKDLW
ncbi:PREDICTED: uncharacterized protein LOC106806733 isoform X2 [Priapulus caudatus]|uniref:Uncharacterized protein LOC106806733 isoform X2 n=1 Tax=Priapulus caudatus TaxID=37621 RepID=A0ABM1DWE0_PRICU|nr:PREDICTED: uncharacterized protein LOC106806733 isoform X2 [Priapulus caudatus]